MRLTISSIFVSPMSRSATLRPSSRTVVRVADHEQILKPVRDQNDAHPFGAHLMDEIEDSVDLGDRERGRRLVHDEHQGVERHRASDRNALALAA